MSEIDLTSTPRRSSGREELLSATVQSAVKLLRCREIDEAIPEILATLGTATDVDRMQLLHMQRGETDGIFRCARHFGWCAPGISPPEGLKSIVGRDIAADGFGEWADKFRRGEIVAGSVDSFAPHVHAFFARDNVKSIIGVPIFVGGEWWGCIGFDSCRSPRGWLAGEIEVLKMLSEVIGVAVQRTRTLAELADANRIIERSAAILFRLMPKSTGYALTYVSSNICRYGYSAAELLARPDEWAKYVDAADLPLITEAINGITSGELTEFDAEFRFIAPDGSRIWFYASAKTAKDAWTNAIAIEGIATDITDRKQAALEIEKLASTDIVTGLANRGAFLRRLGEACDRANVTGGRLALHFVDLDDFKQVNDAHGHCVGDELLRAVAGRLEHAVRGGDLVARFGGDEFAVLQVDPPSLTFAETTAQRICSAIAKPYKVGSKTVSVGASVGVDFSDDAKAEGDAMLARADRALYRAKAAGRNCVRVHTEEMDAIPASGSERQRSSSAA